MMFGKPKRNKVVTIRMDKDELDKLAAQAKATHKTVSDFVRGAVLPNCATDTVLICNECKHQIVDRDYRSWDVVRRQRKHVHESCMSAKRVSS